MKLIVLIKKKFTTIFGLELPTNERFSTKFRNQNNTPDNMIISSSLAKNKDFHI